MFATSRYDGPQALTIAPTLRQLYASVFDQLPPGGGTVTTHFRTRLDCDTRRPGFRAVLCCAGETRGPAVGFATGWITEAPFRRDRAYGDVIRQLGDADVHRYLVGALEVDELAVLNHFRRSGFGAQLLAELVVDAPRGRAWLLTSVENLGAIAFYERCGWRRIGTQDGADQRVVVFVSPENEAQSQL
jgi:ribosomal protein S18 acetylase RimI-like enzyme